MKGPKNTTVMLVDDHYVVRMGFQAIIECEPSIKVVASVGSGREAIEVGERTRPDVTLLDLRMPDFDGIRVLRAIRQYSLRAKVVVVSTFDTNEDIFQAANAGADGFLSKTAKPEELIGAILTVAAGGKAFPPDIEAKLQARKEIKLTSRHYDMIRLLQRGYTNEGIAAELHISHDTVKTHLKNLYLLLGASNRLDAIRIATERGIVKTS